MKTLISSFMLLLCIFCPASDEVCYPLGSSIVFGGESLGMNTYPKRSMVMKLDGIQNSLPDRITAAGFSPEKHLILTLSRSAFEPIYFNPLPTDNNEEETNYFYINQLVMRKKFPGLFECHEDSKENINAEHLKSLFFSKTECKDREKIIIHYDPCSNVLVIKAKAKDINTFFSNIGARGYPEMKFDQEPFIPAKKDQLTEKTRKLLNEITISSDEFPEDELSCKDLFRHMENLSKKYDRDHKGVKIELKQWTDELPEEFRKKIPYVVHMRVEGLSLLEYIKYTCRAIGYSYYIKGDMVIIHPSDMALEPLKTAFHQMGEGSEARLFEYLLNENAITQNFPRHKIKPIRGAKFEYDPVKRIVSFTNTEENLELLREHVPVLDTAWFPVIVEKSPQMLEKLKKLEGRSVEIKGGTDAYMLTQ